LAWSWLAATVVVAALAGAQSFATRDELELIETLARDGFCELAQARLAALEPRLAPAELPLAAATAARVARSAAARAPAAQRIEILRGAAASLAAALSRQASPPPPEPLRCERVAALRELAAALSSGTANDPGARAGALDALGQARHELELLFDERRHRADALAAALPLAPGPAAAPGRAGDAARSALRAATVDAWLPVLDAARLCFDEAALLASDDSRDDPRRTARLRSAREQADQFAWKVGALSLRTLDARLLAARAAFELGEFDESAARMKALFDDERGFAAAFELAPELRRAAAQTWFDALAAAARNGGAGERAALHDALPRLEPFGAKGAPFLLAVDEFDGALAPSISADERSVRCETALLWLRLVADDDKDHERALLLAARCTMELAAAGHAHLADALAPLDELAAFAAAHAPTGAGATHLRARLLDEAELDRGEILHGLDRDDEALARWRALARTLSERISRGGDDDDERTLLREVARALGGELVERGGADETRPGVGTGAEAAELWARLASGAPPDDEAARGAWCEANFYSIWCLDEGASDLAKRRLADFDAALARAAETAGGDAARLLGATWSRRFDALRARRR
jgi:hypothetical protein